MEIATKQDRIKATMQKSGIPAKEIEVYGSQSGVYGAGFDRVNIGSLPAGRDFGPYGSRRDTNMTNTHEAYAEVQSAIESGRAWGEQEIEAWKDQHDGDFSAVPAWTRGTYCGELPADESRDMIEAIIDIEAERIWNEARYGTMVECVAGEIGGVRRTGMRSESSTFVCCDCKERFSDSYESFTSGNETWCMECLAK